jgi:uncharacterized protein with PIN domain
MAGLAAAGLVAMSTPTLAAFPPAINLSDLDGSNGFVINGIDVWDGSGRSVSAAGDINGDGIADVIIGASGADPSGIEGAGESYVVFGRRDGFPAALNLSELLDGSNGFAINGIDAGDSSGNSVSAAGDVNGDGIDDVIIGAWRAYPNGIKRAGESYVVFGRTTGFPAALNLSDLNGSNGFVINGIDVWDISGNSVSAARDVNGDGIDDVIIGAPWAGSNDIDQTGESYVVFGRTTGFPAALNLSDLDGSNGFVINGSDHGIETGWSVSAAGDINGDGIDDVIIGAYNAGDSYVLFGHTTGFPASINLSYLDGSNGFRIDGGVEEVASIVSAAGDVNGDGIDDVIIGYPEGAGSAGESYVVFGRTNGFPAALSLSDLDGSNGFVINGIDALDESGRSVSAAGDVNGDGIADVIIGAPFSYDDEQGDTASGESYVVFGRTTGFPAALNLSDLDGSNGFVINGIDLFDEAGWSVSSAGDVNDDGIDDVIIGAYWADPNGIMNAGESYVVFGRADAVPMISIDIKPGNKRNAINPRAKGGIWVAILSNTGPESPFDPSSQVDIPTVEFGPDGAKANRHKVKDINKDGLGDLLLRFKIPETGIACGDTEATLTGETFEDQRFTGTDSIKTVGCKPKKCHKKKHHEKHHDDDHDDDKKHHGKHNEKKCRNKHHDDHKKR